MEMELGNQVFFKEGDIEAGGEVHKDTLQRRILELKMEGRPTEGQLKALKRSGLISSLLIAGTSTTAGGALTAFTTWKTPNNLPPSTSGGLMATWIGLAILSLVLGTLLYYHDHGEKIEETISTREDVDYPPTQK